LERPCTRSLAKVESPILRRGCALLRISVTAFLLASSVAARGKSREPWLLSIRIINAEKFCELSA